MTVNVKGSTVYGSTAEYSGDVYVHGNFEGATKIGNYCVIEKIVRSMWNLGLTVTPNVVGESVRDLSGFSGADDNLMHTATGKTNPLAVVRNGNYLYYQNENETYASITEYNLLTQAKTTIQVVAGTNGIRYGVIGGRQIGVLYLLGDATHHDVYVLDFAVETSVKAHSFLRDWTDGDYQYFTTSTQYFSTMFVEYSNEVYLVAAFPMAVWDNGAAPYEENDGVCWFVYNFDTETAQSPIWQPHNDSRTSYPGAASIQSPLAYYSGKVLCLPTTVDFDDGTDGTPFHVLDLSSFTAAATFFESGAGWETYPGWIAIDHTNGVAYASITFQAASTDATIIKFVFSSSTPSVWKNNAYGYSICAGQTAIYFYDEEVDKWYDINWTELLAITEPASGYSYADGVSFAFDDTTQRIWHYDSSGPNLKGIRVTDGDVKTVSTTVEDPDTSPNRMTVFLLIDLFVLVSSKVSSDVCYYTVEAA